MTQESRLTHGWFQEFTQDDMLRRAERRRQRWTEVTLINPPVQTLHELCLKATYGDLRGLLHDGDLYWWDSAYGTHHDAQCWLKIAGSKLDCGVELHSGDDGSVGLCAFEDAVMAAVLVHPTLIDCVTDDYTVIPNPTLRLPF